MPYITYWFLTFISASRRHCFPQDQRRRILSSDVPQMLRRSLPDFQQPLALSKYLTFDKYLTDLHLWPKWNNRN